MSTPIHTTSYDDICLNVRTTHERSMLYNGIEALTEALYKKKAASLEEIIDTQLPYAVARPLKGTLMRLPLSSPDAAKEFLAGLHDALTQLQILSLEVAFEPTEETIAVLTVWMREHIGADVIMDISIDRTLLGGSRISFGGRYKEINLASIIESALGDQREIIKHMLYE
ncbi:MAG: hypothetical protein G01um101429_238 [Parcubacteria group bacterium Gr01-1014_29]|nr:MAG: hypothetical protein G01um101429_238 [Parcubacteria group bacterium Gr01-1014_29]